MKQGDFTSLAKEYVNRPGYSIEVIRMLGNYVGMNNKEFRVADVGAGTGKLTENLSSVGLTGVAVEPNDAMRAEGEKLFFDNKNFIWKKGTAEDTGLETASVDWVLMGSSFHWTDASLALKEFRRILKPGGYFTAIYNPRQIEGFQLFEEIEQIVEKEVPELKRVSSGSKKNVGDIEERLLSTGDFGNLISVEAPFSVQMTKERYLGAWRSVNDIQAQAGEERFEKIIDKIKEKVADLDLIDVPYRCRSWTVKRID